MRSSPSLDDCLGYPTPAYLTHASLYGNLSTRTNTPTGTGHFGHATFLFRVPYDGRAVPSTTNLTWLWDAGGTNNTTVTLSTCGFLSFVFPVSGATRIRATEEGGPGRKPFLMG
jgi:hypothetical protein